MKRMAMKQTITTGLMFLSLVLTNGVSAAGDDQGELAHLLEAFLEGASVNDAAVHDRFWADDLIYTSSDGQRFGKDEIMASLAEAGSAGQEEAPKPPQYSARDITVRIFGDSAVVTFRLMALRNGEIVGEYLNTGVFRKGEPGWQAVTWQATRAAGD